MARYYSSSQAVQRPLLWIVALTTSPLVSGAASAEVVNHVADAGGEHKSTRLRSSAARALRAKKWHDPSFYGAFAEAESTYDVDADGGRAGNLAGIQDGWEPGLSNPYSMKGSVPAEWFHESESGGPEAAWQTHYPTLTDGLAHNGIRLGKWVHTASGQWEQEYKGQAEYDQETKGNMQSGNIFDVLKGKKALKPAWFDAAVGQVDGFGRPKQPTLASGKRYVGWEERAVNTTVACSTPGCTAGAMLQAFDPAKEQATHCRMAAHVMPTDFGQGSVELIEVNGMAVSQQCKPPKQGTGCDETRTLYPCLQELDLETLMAGSAALNITARISDTVTACPYQGSLLYIVPMVTCLVTAKAPPADFSDVLQPNATVLQPNATAVLQPNATAQ